MNGRSLSTAALTLLVAVALPAGAQGASEKAKGKRIDDAVAAASKQSEPAASRSKSKDGDRSSDVEIRIIRDYFAARSERPKPLPPGIAKNLARGKPLPPGIAKRYAPDDLVLRLPKREGMRWILAGDTMVLVDVTGVVRDIVKALL